MEGIVAAPSPLSRDVKGFRYDRLRERRIRAANWSMSDSSDNRKSRNRTPLFLHVSLMLSRMRYSRIPLTVLVPPKIFRNRANALIACSALLLFQGTPS